MGKRFAYDPETKEEFSAVRTAELDADLDIYEQASCKHEQTVIASVKISDGRSSIRKVCEYCGELFGPALSQKSFADLPRDFDHVSVSKIYHRQRFEVRKAIIVRHNQISEAKAADWQKKYGDYLRSEEWKKKKKLVLKRANYMCEGCGINPASEIHHLTYEHRFYEFLFELVALCLTCHSLIHIEKNEKLRATKVDHPEMLCSACRFQGENGYRKWCFIYDIAAEAALRSPDHCNNGKSGFEGLK